METYICIGKCVPTPASLSRVLPLARSSDRTSFAPAVSSLLSRPPPLADPQPSAFRHWSFVRLVSTHDAFSSLAYDPAISLSLSFSHPLFPSLAPSRFLPRRASALVALAHSFFSPMPPFFSSARPRGRRVIFIICYLLRRTPPVCRRVSGAARPEKPENRGKQKSGRRGAPCIPLGGWYARTAAAAVGEEETRWRRRGRKKRKRHRGTSSPTRRIIRASACARLSRARGS